MRTYTPVQRRKDWIGVNINPNVTPGGFCAKQKKMTMLELKHACREGASQHPLPNPFELAQSLPAPIKPEKWQGLEKPSNYGKGPTVY